MNPPRRISYSENCQVAILLYMSLHEDYFFFCLIYAQQMFISVKDFKKIKKGGKVKKNVHAALQCPRMQIVNKITLRVWLSAAFIGLSNALLSMQCLLKSEYVHNLAQLF